MRARSDAELRSLTGAFRARLGNGEALDHVLPEAFAVVREAARRVLGERPVDAQVMGGVALHLGAVADMKTGEGKTLTATMPAYLNALTGHGVHVATSNDYLAKRDAEWMGAIYRFLGVTVGLIVPEMSEEERREAYQADITYAGDPSFGYDYLRDNTVWALEDYVQRGHHYAIVDEADWVLIDEASTPLIISVPAAEDEMSPRWIAQFAQIAAQLQAGVHYEIAQGRNAAVVTDAGLATVEDLLGTGNLFDSPLWRVLNNAIKAKEFYRNGVDYVVQDGRVSAVDEVTGRVHYGRQFSDGIHGAIEAKEGLEVGAERQILGTVTVGAYFRLYDKLAGMTGTAKPDAAEYHDVYGLDVVEIPTHWPVRRIDHPDLLYATVQAKLGAMVEKVAECNATGQPVLIGTHEIEESERITRMLEERAIPHHLLNADSDEQEARVIAQAGRLGAVTVATGMFGRGTDIRLGGPEDHERDAVVERGGLCVISTHRYRYRRLDDHLRGRAGRRGDPGESRFYWSAEEWRRTSRFELRFFPEGEPIKAGRVLNRGLTGMQQEAEERAKKARALARTINDVENEQRSVVYATRRSIVEGTDLRERVRRTVSEVVRMYVTDAAPLATRNDLAALLERLAQLYPISITLADVIGDRGVIPPAATIADLIEPDIHTAYDRRERKLGSDLMRELERRILLSVTDRNWRRHLTDLDVLQDELGLRALGTRDPLTEYRREAHTLVTAMTKTIKEETVGYLFNIKVELAD